MAAVRGLRRALSDILKFLRGTTDGSRRIAGFSAAAWARKLRMGAPPSRKIRRLPFPAHTGPIRGTINVGVAKIVGRANSASPTGQAHWAVDELGNIA